MSAVPAPILIVGAGHMGGALITGWRVSETLSARDLIIWDPSPGPVAKMACDDGARLNPPLAHLADAEAVVLAVKPQNWRAAVAKIAPWLSAEARVISIMAGVRISAIREIVGPRVLARVMPNTAAGICQGAAGASWDDADAGEIVHLLFEPLGVVVDLREEWLLDVVTAVSGSGPAYLYALIEALEGAALNSGLDADAAARLTRATITGAAALLATGGESAADLRRQVTSPGGTTQAAMDILLAPGGLRDLLDRAVGAAVDRSAKLGARQR
jgi:pyrroline-5-carboxylate reductase